MKIKTQDLTGAALDWAVAKCEGWEGIVCKNPSWAVPLYVATNDTGLYTYAPSTDPSHGHPIIERELIGTMPVSDAWWRAGDVDGANGFGPTMLIAAMRCYVASTLGDTVGVPEELL